MDTSISTQNARPALALNPQLLTSLAWWHWLFTAGLIATHYVAWPDAIVIARVLCALMLVLRVSTDRGPTRRVQVYAGFLVFLFIGELPNMGWYYCTMLVGTLLNCTIGYCPLDRMLQTLPFNNTQPNWLIALRDAAIGNLLIGGLIRRSTMEPGHADAKPSCM